MLPSNPYSNWYANTHRELSSFVNAVDLSRPNSANVTGHLPLIVQNGLGNLEQNPDYDNKKYFDELSRQISSQIPVDRLPVQQIINIVKIYKVVRDRAMKQLNEGERDISRIQIERLKEKAVLRPADRSSWRTWEAYQTHIGAVLDSFSSIEHPSIEHHLDTDGNTFLHTAAKNGNLNLVRLLISEGADRLAKNKNGDTPLHMACRSSSLGNNLEIITLLTQNVIKGDVTIDPRTILNANGQAPCHVVAQNVIPGEVSGHLSDNVRQIYDLLILQIHAEQRDIDGKSLLHLALEAGNTPYLFFLSKKYNWPPLYKHLDNSKRTPLHLAVMSGKIDALVECLATFEQFRLIVAEDKDGKDIFVLAEEHDKQYPGQPFSQKLKNVTNRKVITTACKYLQDIPKKIEKLIGTKELSKTTAEIEDGIYILAKMQYVLQILEPDIARAYQERFANLASILRKARAAPPAECLLSSDDFSFLSDLVKERNIAYATPFHRAMANNDKETCNTLFPHLEYYFIRDPQENLLHTALRIGNVEMARKIISNYRNLNVEYFQLLFAENEAHQSSVQLAAKLNPDQIKQLFDIKQILSFYEVYIREILLQAANEGNAGRLSDEAPFQEKCAQLFQLLGPPISSLFGRVVGRITAALLELKTATSKDYSTLTEAIESFSQIYSNILTAKAPIEVLDNLKGVLNSTQVEKMSLKVLEKATAIHFKYPDEETILNFINRLAGWHANIQAGLNVSESEKKEHAEKTETPHHKETLADIKALLPAVEKALNVLAELERFSDFGASMGVIEAIEESGIERQTLNEEEAIQAATIDGAGIQLRKTFRDLDKPYTIAAIQQALKNALGKKQKFGERLKPSILYHPDQRVILKLMILDRFTTEESFFDLMFFADKTPEIFTSVEIRDEEFIAFAMQDNSFPQALKTQLRETTSFSMWKTEEHPEAYRYWCTKFLKIKNTKLEKAQDELRRAFIALKEDKAVEREVKERMRKGKLDPAPAFCEYLADKFILADSLSEPERKELEASDSLRLQRCETALNALVGLISFEQNVYNAISQELISPFFR